MGKSDEEIARLTKELQPVEIPASSGYLLRVFQDLSSTRAYGFGGPLAITYTEIQAYINLTHLTLSPWEISVLRELDVTYLSEHSKLGQSK